MSTHIALIGRTKEPVLKGFQHYGEIGKLYLLHSPNSKEFAFKDVALEVQAGLAAIGFRRTTLVEIDAFDMQDIISKILSIANTEKSPLFVNITGGTNLMAGSACAASFFVGAQAYYVMGKTGSDISESKVVELPVPLIPYHKIVDENQLRILGELNIVGGRSANARLRERIGISPQVMSYHVKVIEAKGLNSTKKPRPSRNAAADRRALEIALTPAGRLVLSWRSSTSGLHATSRN